MRSRSVHHRLGGPFESLFALSPLGMARLDLTGAVIDVNDALIERSGYGRSALVGRHLRDFTTPEDVAVADELIAELGQAKATARELRLVDKRGTLVSRNLIVVPTFEQSRLTGGFLVIQDITARIQAEQLRRSLFAHNPHGIAMIDRSGSVMDANDALLAMSGYSREEMIGSKFTDFSGIATLPTAKTLLARTLEGEPQHAECRPRRKSGDTLDVMLTTIPMRIDDAIAGAYVVLEDITERKSVQETLTQQAERLADSEARFRSLFEQNPSGVLALDREGVIVDANDALLELGHNTREMVIGRNFRVFLSDAERREVEAQFGRVLRGETLHYEMLYQNKNTGETQILEVNGFPMLSAGQIVGCYQIIHDATKERATERRVANQSQRIRELYLAAANSAAESQILATLEIGCRTLSMSVGAVVKCAAVSTIEQRFDAKPHPKDDEAILQLANEAAQRRAAFTLTPERRMQSHYRSAIAAPIMVAGHPYGALCFASPGKDIAPFEETDLDVVSLMSALIGSAIERRRSRANLRTLAYYDSLTSLPNRVFFQDRLRDALENAQSEVRRVAVLFLDLDRFKDVNDTLGHALGDRLLQLVAARLVEHLGDRGTVARLGGDEFALLLPNCDSLEDIRAEAETVLAVIDEPYQIDEYEQFITASIGIAVYPDDGKDDQVLIKNADIAMYRAKDLGRSSYQVYAPSLESTIHMRLSQEKLLRRALENKEFVVHYQPQVDMASGKIIVLEALVRWNHPKTGIILPARFIPSAEASGLIVPLGDWVLRTAAEQVCELQQRYPELRVAVNLSAKQFHQRDLRRRILQTLSAAGLSANSLELEITETVAMSDAASSVEIMRDLVESGIHMGLDDFGTGYSSLSYLRRFPTAVLKIDRSFVAGIGAQRNDETIVITVIAMAHNLGLEVVAEGVETREQYEFLKTYGCNRVQGYYISPAVSISGIAELLAEWKPSPV